MSQRSGEAAGPPETLTVHMQEQITLSKTKKKTF